MGFFSKKTFICEKCGKEYQTRISVGEHVCGECKSREKEKTEKVFGYVCYASDLSWDPYTEEELDAIARHRDGILNKCRVTEGITPEQLRQAGDNCKKLTDAEAQNVLDRLINSVYETSLGAVRSKKLFSLTTYEDTVIDKEDVFAVGYTRDSYVTAENAEALLCVIFTNDPYIPVFPMVYFGKTGLFEMFKSRKGRQAVENLFEIICPNLTYPVQELKELKKQISADGSVKGTPDVKFMLEKISEASSGSGIFNSKRIKDRLYLSSEEMLASYGWIDMKKAVEILQADKISGRKYWEKQLRKYEERNL